MFGKLLKHEFRATSPLVLLVWAAVIGFSGLSSLFRLLCRELDIFWLPMTVTTFFTVILAIASVVVVYVLIIRRFYVNVYGDEGYLTLTLPVTRGSIIWSKLICGIVWVIGTVIVVFGAVMLRMTTEDAETLNEVLNMLGMTASLIVDFSGVPIWAVSTELFAFLLVSLVKSIMLFYAAISLGQFFTGHRLLGSVISYLGLNVVGRVVDSLYSLIMGISKQGLNIAQQFYYNYSLDKAAGFEIQVSIILYIVLVAVWTAVLWLLTDFIMRRAVNLQ